MALQALAAAALAEEAERSLTAQADADAELLADAQQYAEMVIGEEAAAVLGAWSPVDGADCPPDTWQATVDLGPGSALVYAMDSEGVRSLTLSGTCLRCGHHEDVAVRSLQDLGRALRQTGGGRG